MDFLFNKWTLCISTVVCMGVLYRKYTTGKCTSKRRMDGKTVIITGASAGIGKETARGLAARGARVIMACRNMKKADKVRDDIVASTGNHNVVTRHLDLASFSSVRRFVELILRTENRLDVLINNAGLGWVGRMFTEDNILVGIQVNHFGHFLLTVLLVDLMKKSTPSRIITVSSSSHSLLWGSFDLDDLNGEKSFSNMNVYSVSKLCNIFMSNELARRLEGTGVTSNSVHPGPVETEFFNHFHLIHWMLIKPFVKLIFKTAEEGAQTSIHCAVSEEVEGVTGKYFVDCQERKPSSLALDEGLARKLWEKSEIFVKLKPEEIKLY